MGAHDDAYIRKAAIKIPDSLCHHYRGRACFRRGDRRIPVGRAEVKSLQMYHQEFGKLR